MYMSGTFRFTSSQELTNLRTGFFFLNLLRRHLVRYGNPEAFYGLSTSLA